MDTREKRIARLRRKIAYFETRGNARRLADLSLRLAQLVAGDDDVPEVTPEPAVTEPKERRQPAPKGRTVPPKMRAAK